MMIIKLGLHHHQDLIPLGDSDLNHKTHYSTLFWQIKGSSCLEHFMNIENIFTHTLDKQFSFFVIKKWIERELQLLEKCISSPLRMFLEPYWEESNLHL